MSSVPPPPPPTITLIPAEASLFTFLLSVALTSPTPVVLRVAGGWVRDKLLSKQSSDIDIALDTLSGVDFATLCCEYLEGKEEEPDKKKPKFATIQSNPEQSKHLETATMNLFDYSIDFTNLRTETYSSTTNRIPEIAFGTPSEDSSRRDFTVNSLFYNITTSKIEDYYNGISDLNNGIIRTPLNPKLTFLDDPLRVLRGVRFSSRFGFCLEGGVVGAMKDDEVREALRMKVSKERVGKELTGCFKTDEGGVEAFKLLTSLKLDEVIFECPDGVKLGHQYVSKVDRYVGVPGVDIRLLLISAILSPNASETFEELQKNGKTYKPRNKVHWVIRDGIKWKSQDASDVQMLVESLGVGGDLLRNAEADRLECGMFLRNCKGLWRTGLALAAIKMIGNGEDASDLYEKTTTKITNFNLEDCWKQKPVVDGKTLQMTLNLGKGPEVGKWMKKVVEFMLVNEGGSKEQCIEYLKECKEREMEMEMERGMEVEVEVDKKVDEGVK